MCRSPLALCLYQEPRERERERERERDKLDVEVLGPVPRGLVLSSFEGRHAREMLTAARKKSMFVVTTYPIQIRRRLSLHYYSRVIPREVPETWGSSECVQTYLTLPPGMSPGLQHSRCLGSVSNRSHSFSDWLAPSCNWLHAFCNWLAPSCHWLHASCNWLAPSCNWLHSCSNWLAPSCHWLHSFCN